ncbi:hypothetical protein [Nocardia sp. NPDC056100]|uniref:hypothetical protein n=1 Tax=Nocardia sp. NPDC056100 TaxID=3345712 RepID=UPI0035DEF21F
MEPDGASAIPELSIIPDTEVKPEELAALTLRYNGDVPEIVVQNSEQAHVFPRTLPIRDGSGNLIALYAAYAIPTASTRALPVYSGNYNGLTIDEHLKLDLTKLDEMYARRQDSTGQTDDDVAQYSEDWPTGM